MPRSPDLLPTWDAEKALHVVVETPKGSRAKFAFDPELETFILSKSLLFGLSYPYDWGFIPSTKAPDGDPLDAIVIHEATTYPGTVLKCRILGLLEVSQTENGKVLRNDRVIATPSKNERYGSLKDFSRAMRKELEEFFTATHASDGVKLRFLGWRNPESARSLIRRVRIAKPK